MDGKKLWFFFLDELHSVRQAGLNLYTHYQGLRPYPLRYRTVVERLIFVILRSLSFIMADVQTLLSIANNRLRIIFISMDNSKMKWYCLRKNEESCDKQNRHNQNVQCYSTFKTCLSAIQFPTVIFKQVQIYNTIPPELFPHVSLSKSLELRFRLFVPLPSMSISQ